MGRNKTKMNKIKEVTTLNLKISGTLLILPLVANWFWGNMRTVFIESPELLKMVKTNDIIFNKLIWWIIPESWKATLLIFILTILSSTFFSFFYVFNKKEEVKLK